MQRGIEKCCKKPGRNRLTQDLPLWKKSSLVARIFTVGEYWVHVSSIVAQMICTSIIFIFQGQRGSEGQFLMLLSISLISSQKLAETQTDENMLPETGFQFLTIPISCPFFQFFGLESVISRKKRLFFLLFIWPENQKSFSYMFLDLSQFSGHFGHSGQTNYIFWGKILIYVSQDYDTCENVRNLEGRGSEVKILLFSSFSTYQNSEYGASELFYTSEKALSITEI